jgi:hypothetical protein
MGIPGGVSEWSKETVLKTVGPDPGLVGSNPTPSAPFADRVVERGAYNVQRAALAVVGEVAEWSKALAC